MMKKISIITMALMLFITGTIMPLKKVEATPLALPAGIAGAGVGVYVTAALLVAGGAAAVGYDEYGEDITRHANDVWDNSTQLFKDSVISSYEESVKLGKSTISLTQEMYDYLSLEAGNLALYAKGLIYNQYYGSSYQNLYSASKGYGTYGPYFKIQRDYLMFINGWSAYSISYNYYNTTDSWAIEGLFVADGNKILASGPGELEAFKSPNSVEGEQEILKLFQAHVGSIYFRNADDSPAVPASATMGGAITAELDRLRAGTGEIWLPKQDVIPKTILGQTLVADAVGNMTLQDGTPYTGDIDFGIPLIGAPNTTYDNPTTSLDNLTVGEGAEPLIQEPVFETPTTGTGDISGIVTGLWDWLKGILQSILDAIKAVASSIVAGLTGLLENIIGAINAVTEIVSGLVVALIDALVAVFVPSDGYFVNFFKEIKSAYDAKIPIVGQIFAFLTAIKEATFGQNIPSFLVELPQKYGGGVYKIINFEYFTDYRSLILNFIRFTAWFIFIKRLWNRLPKVVY